MNNYTIGILAHVDAGKTTLIEQLLVAAGQRKEAGRVDHGTAFLDTEEQERARGITISSKMCRLSASMPGRRPGSFGRRCFRRRLR